MNFWKQLSEKKKPFFALAPMADVTDMAFRQIICETGKPDVFYTEFVSADGLAYAMSGAASAKATAAKAKLLPHLKFKDNERPIVAQFFGSRPENFYKAARLAVELGFDGIDINMGCPDRKVMKQNSGASLVLNPALAQSIIRETKRGTGGLPVSVKTRLGHDKIVTEEWISKLIETEPAAIILHGRTAKEMSKVPAHWDEIGKAARLCRAASIPFIGNGDVMSYDEGKKRALEFDLQGIMVGRGIFHNPWFFAPLAGAGIRTPEARIRLLKKHIENFSALWGRDKNFDVMKRFIKIYINDFNGAKNLRDELMTKRNAPDTLECLARWETDHGLTPQI